MAWQAETFGPRQTVAGVVDHIRRELIEVEANPADPMEPIDLLNLAVSLLRLAGATPDQICQLWRLKFGMLQARTWPDWRTADSDRAIEHDRSAEPPTQPEGLADFGLLVSFPDQSPSFVHGFEAGMIWMDLRDSADPFDLTMHSANRVLATRIASHHGWNVTFRATEFEEWTTASFARGSRPALTSIDGGRAATPQEPR
ncbi:DUF550 domain-containing protein [Mycobacterium sp. KBS0706]|nr:DUF550 domain-containing protein [Mycobacterium sp. KBS0706]